MKRGFMDFAATRLIPQHPGETAEYYAQEYVEVAGEEASDAQNPVMSLANTLRKRVGTGGEKRIRREKTSGVYRYYPANAEAGNTSAEQKSVAVQAFLLPDELKILDDFVVLGKFSSRGQVLAWLAREGIKSRHADVEKVAEIAREIDSLKGSAPPL